ncbi:MAG: hypothetical protein HQL32_15105 [Planctomycetes bacterium]|nr:hypothetical protein [Planctomycetota bacterium]
MKTLKSSNQYKLQKTFSKVVPGLKSGGGVVAFVCKQPPEVMVYSIYNGELVVEKALASEVVSVLLRLKSRELPWNLINPSQVNVITKSFEHIHEFQGEELKSSYSDTDLENLKFEIAALFSNN